MIKTFTPNDIIAYLYGERISSKEVSIIEQNIANEPHLADVFYKSQQTKDWLDGLEMNPSEACIDKILAYSKSTN